MDEEKALEYYRDRQNEKSKLFRFANKKDELIGTTCAMNMFNDKMDLGIMLKSTERGKGIGLKIWKMTIEALKELEVVKVTAGSDIRNKTMVKIMQKTMNFKELYINNRNLCVRYQIDLIWPYK